MLLAVRVSNKLVSREEIKNKIVYVQLFGSVLHYIRVFDIPVSIDTALIVSITLKTLICKHPSPGFTPPGVDRTHRI